MPGSRIWKNLGEENKTTHPNGRVASEQKWRHKGHYRKCRRGETAPINKNTGRCPFSPKSSFTASSLPSVYLQKTASERERSTIIAAYKNAVTVVLNLYLKGQCKQPLTFNRNHTLNRSCQSKTTTTVAVLLC